MAQRSSTDALEFVPVSSTIPASPPYFLEALTDTERLLKYAAEVGVDVHDDTRQHVLRARSQSAGAPSDETAANLLAALTTLTGHEGEREAGGAHPPTHVLLTPGDAWGAARAIQELRAGDDRAVQHR